jgi:hypothetical protein
VNAEFNWWLLIVGLGIGAGLVWLVLADVRRREDEVGKAERSFEASWIADTLRARGKKIEPETAEQVLELHQVYLSSLPPDEAPIETADEVDRADQIDDAKADSPDAADRDEHFVTADARERSMPGEAAVGRRTERPV